MVDSAVPRKEDRRVRMEEVAKHAGVSLMTVSRAIHSPDIVTAKTRARIDAAIAELGYVRHAAAGQLASGQTRLVAVVLPDLRNPAFALAMQGLSDALGQEFELIATGSHAGTDGETRVIRTLLGYRPAGFVIHGTRHSPEARLALSRSGVPTVEIGSLVNRPIDMVVGYSNREAGRAATEHLLARGRRTIAFVSQPRAQNDRADERWHGYREALAAAGLPIRPELEIETELGFEKGAQALDMLRTREKRLDAIFFASDTWAMGAVFHGLRHGIKIPKDIAVIGFDDQEFAAQSYPALTTIHVPRYEMGVEAGKLLNARLAGTGSPRRRLDLGFRLIARETT